MTRKDFIVIAKILARFEEPSYSVRCFIDNALTAQNPRFMPSKFWQYVDGERRKLCH